jgi:hypothetical protein
MTPPLTLAQNPRFEPIVIDYHKIMLATTTAVAAVRRGAGVLALARDFWSVERRFKQFIALLNSLETAPEADVRELVSGLQGLHKQINRVLDLAAQRGLFNRTLTAHSLQSIKTTNIELKELIEDLELSLDPKLDGMVAEAVREFQDGETISLDTLCQ